MNIHSHIHLSSKVQRTWKRGGNIAKAGASGGCCETVSSELRGSMQSWTHSLCGSCTRPSQSTSQHGCGSSSGVPTPSWWLGQSVFFRDMRKMSLMHIWRNAYPVRSEQRSWGQIMTERNVGCGTVGDRHPPQLHQHRAQIWGKTNQFCLESLLPKPFTLGDCAS